MNNTEKRIDPAAALSDIGGEMILEAAPTGAKKRSRKRILIASAAALAAAAAVVLMLTFLTKAAGNKPGLTQAEADKPEPAVIENTEEPAPEITAEPDKEAVVIPMRAIPIGAASTGEELNELYIEHREKLQIQPGTVNSVSHGDGWIPPTPAEVLGDPEASVFRGTVTKIEYFDLVYGDSGDDAADNLYQTVSVVTFRVKECYKGTLEPGSETQVFFFNFIYSGWAFEPPIGEPGSAYHYPDMLKPGVEVIMLDYASPDEGWELDPCREDGAVFHYRFFCSELAEYYFRRNASGTLFIDDGSRFLYDTEVYDKTMLGEKPSLDFAEAFIIGVINGKAV